MMVQYINLAYIIFDELWMLKWITLKNLHLATEQEVFDQVARHLLTQTSTDGPNMFV